MKQKLLLYIVNALFVLLIISNFALAQNDSLLQTENPVYFLETYQSNIAVNKGENVTISYFIIGKGDVDEAELKISFPGNVIEESVNIKAFKKVVTDNRNETINNIDYSIGTMRPKGTLELSQDFFKNTPNGEFNIANSEIRDEEGRYHGPFEFEYTISKNAEPGDYDTSVTLFYKFEDTWYRDTIKTNIHVREFYEIWYWQVFITLTIAIIAAMYSKHSKKDKNTDDSKRNDKTSNKRKSKRK
jgi:hypothetical protein